MRTVRTGRLQVLSRLIGEYIYHPAGAMAAINIGANLSGNASSSDSYSYSVMAKPSWIELASGSEDELEGK